MSDYKKAFENFSNIIEEMGVTIEHSGCGKKQVFDVKEWLELDEIQAEQCFSDCLDSNDLECSISLEEAIDISDWEQWELENLPSKYEQFIITFDEFDHSAIKENPSGEVVRILQSIIKNIENYGLENCDTMYLKDYNGNTVGNVEVTTNN